MSFTHLIAPPKIAPMGGRFVVDAETINAKELQRIKKRAYHAELYKRKRDEKIAAAKAWAAANPDKVSAIKEKHRKKHRKLIALRQRMRYEQTREQYNARRRAKYATEGGREVGQRG